MRFNKFTLYRTRVNNSIMIRINAYANAGYGFALTCVFILLNPLGFGLNQSLNMHTS